MNASDFLTDREAAEIFGISVQTLRHHCMGTFECPPGRVDVRDAEPVKVGRFRRWNRHRIAALLNAQPGARA